MSRPIPLEIIPAHVYLSAEDQKTLFGVGYPMTIAEEYSQAGQHVYRETVEIIGEGGVTLRARVLGPNWAESHAEISSIEAELLGVNVKEARSGDLSGAVRCTLRGPEGEVELERGVLVPKPHLLCSPEEAERLYLSNGDVIRLSLTGGEDKLLEEVVVRVHPTFRLRVEIHQGYAKDLWVVKSTHAYFVDDRHV